MCSGSEVDDGGHGRGQPIDVGALSWLMALS
jgi:hypothetical protein